MLSLSLFLCPLSFLQQPLSPTHTARTLLHPSPGEAALLLQWGIISDTVIGMRVSALRVMPRGQGHPEVFVRSNFSRGNVRRLAWKTPLTLTFLDLLAILTRGLD